MGAIFSKLRRFLADAALHCLNGGQQVSAYEWGDWVRLVQHGHGALERGFVPPAIAVDGVAPRAVLPRRALRTA